MKRILITILLAVPLLSFAQKTKTVKIAPMGYLNITGEISYADDEQTPIDTVYFIVGVDNQFNYSETYSQYKHIAIATGSFQKMYDVMQSTLNMFNEEIGVSLTKYDVKLSLQKPSGIKEVQLHAGDLSDNGFTLVTVQNTKEIISRMELYAQNHRVALKKWK
ncbi:MAG: hypothetical protein JWM14_2227 [Chitinophagaceae bacterium]|nr:hypothetical protein [Chitinophagaceae bacterium]